MTSATLTTRPTGRIRLRLLGVVGVGAVGVLAGAYALGTSGWPAAIAFLCGAGLIAATLRPDRAGFLGAWLGALGAATAVTVRGDYLGNPEYGASFVVFFIAAALIIDGVALSAGFLGAAFIRRGVPSAADRAILVVAGALLLIGLVGVGVVPSATPVVP